MIHPQGHIDGRQQILATLCRRILRADASLETGMLLLPCLLQYKPSGNCADWSLFLAHLLQRSACGRLWGGAPQPPARPSGTAAGTFKAPSEPPGAHV